MNLCFTLPQREAALAAAAGVIHPVYCAPYDARLDGNFLQEGWVAADENRLLIFLNGSLCHNIALEENLSFRCDVQVGGGLLVLVREENGKKEETLLLRMTMRHLARYSYIARGLRLLCMKKETRVASLEPENLCPRCKRAIPGTRACPFCTKQGRMLRRMGQLIQGFTPKMLVLSAIILAITAINAGMRFVEKDFIDRVMVPKTGTAADLWQFGLLSIGGAVVFVVLICLRDYYSSRVGADISMTLRARLYNKMQAMSLADIGRRQPGELLNRITGDTENIRSFLQDTFAMMFNHILIMVVFLGIMLVMNWRLTLISIVMVPFVFIIAGSLRGTFRRIFTSQWRTQDAMNNTLQDILSGIRVVKSFGMEKREMDKFSAVNQKFADIQIRNETFWSTFNPILNFVVTSGSLLILLFGGLSVINEGMTLGELTMFSTFAGWIYGPLGWFSNLPRQIANAATSLNRIFDVLDEENRIRNDSDPIEGRVEGDVVFENVTFGYHSYEPVLEEISFTVKAGERIGLVGASGTGKSTLINLVMRLYDVDEGSITLDGEDLRRYALESLHAQMGVVLQEPFLFSGTLLENIRYAKPAATREEIIKASKIANAHDFICRLPDGYDTRVGEHGYTLSGGERQRVSIARALLNDPRILILDEATSSLDTETEYQIQLALDRLMKGRTSFAIAHRLSTLRNCDRIFVLDKHRLAETGSHDELLRKKGIYYGLVMAQLQMHKVKSVSEKA